MPTIYIETLPLEKEKYQLIRAKAIGYYFQDEIVETVNAENRLHAAILNVGFGCRYLMDYHLQESHNVVKLYSDIDGLDNRFGGEHNILYSLLFPSSGADARKKASLYAEYNRYLTRIKTLIKLARIKVELWNKDNEV